MRRAGGEVVIYDRESESREAIALALASKRDAAFIAPYDDDRIIAGQGTVGLEIAEQAVRLGVSPDLVLVPCSGGGLIAGVAIALRAHLASAEIYCVEPEGFDDMARSLASDKREVNARPSGSVCDALLSLTPGERTFEICREHLAGGLAVDDRAALAAVRFAFERLKVVVEPGGAAALAALLSARMDVSGRTAVVVISGGNIDADLFTKTISA